MIATSSDNHDDCPYWSFLPFLICWIPNKSDQSNIRFLLVLKRKFFSVVIDAVEIMLARYDFKLSNRSINVLNEKFKMSNRWISILNEKISPIFFIYLDLKRFTKFIWTFLVNKYRWKILSISCFNYWPTQFCIFEVQTHWPLGNNVIYHQDLG